MLPNLRTCGSESNVDVGLRKPEYPGEIAPDWGHRETGESRDGCSLSGTERGFNWPLRRLSDVFVAESCALADRRGGAVVRVGVLGVLGPPIFERSCLSYA